MGASAHHRHRCADRRSAAAGAADLDARHARTSDERACVPAHARAQPQIRADAREPDQGTMGSSRPAAVGRKTIVIVGLGILAEHLAARCKLFGMEVIGVSSGRKFAPNFDEVVPRAALRQVSQRADFLMLLVPYSRETHHLVNADVLAAMKPSAFLINLARGGVLDEAAFIAHMKAGKIAGAALDVFSTQPLPAQSPLWHLPNVIISPNVGGHSDNFVEQMLTVVVPNLRAYIEGRQKDLRNLVAH